MVELYFSYFQNFFSQVSAQDFFLIGVLVFLEGVLSVDNALVLAILVKRLSPDMRRKALTYGIWGAFLFRFIALLFTKYLIKWTWVKFVGGGYLVLLALKNLWTGFKKDHDHDPEALSPTNQFWKTVIIIELTDIAFAVDSILAAIALSQKLWVVFVGGVLGIIMMRYAATAFVKLLEKFPRIERVAYVLVLLIGSKVIIEALKLPGVDFHSPKHPAFVVFWSLMLLTIGAGFVPGPKEKPTKH